jgi:hypothetical protein
MEDEWFVNGGQVELDRRLVVLHELPPSLFSPDLASAIDVQLGCVVALFLNNRGAVVVPVFLYNIVDFSD